MAYSFATGGSGWQMVPCMVTFLAEARDCVKRSVRTLLATLNP